MTCRHALVLAAAAFGCALEGADSRSPSQARTEPAAPIVRHYASFLAAPVGIAVSTDDRVFLSFSRAIDETVPVSVVELVDGEPVPFPPGFRQTSGDPALDRLLAVQSLTVDAANRLWILDSGKVGDEPVEPGTVKLVGWDLATHELVDTIAFPASIAGATAFVNDVRVDYARGHAGIAYLTDASAEGPNAIIVVDLATGEARRRLDDHPSTKPEPGRVLELDGESVTMEVGADGIALAGRYVYYAPLASHRLYRIRADVLADPARSDRQVAAAVEDLGDKGFASDGLLGDSRGRVYVTDIEHGRIHRRDEHGEWTIIADDRQLRWPDSLALRADGVLLVTASQIDDSPRFRGEDRRQRPFRVLQIATDSRPTFSGPATTRRARGLRRS